MSSPSIDVLYAKLNKHILLAQSYTEVPELSFIIKGCRLKPYDYIFGKRGGGTKLYELWIDEFGNSFQIKNKKISITFNDLSLNKDKIVCTDLYYGLSLDRIVKMSKLIYLCSGLDEDLHQESFFLTFLGLDNYLRSYMYLYKEWQQVSSLLLGMENLKTLSHHCDIQYFRELPMKKNSPIPCQSVKSYLSSLPAGPSFLEIIKSQCETLLPIFE